jgi:hypothetical protein
MDADSAAQPKGWMLRLMAVTLPAFGFIPLLVAGCLLPISACGSSSGPRCFPSPLAVTPTTVQAGGVVVLSSGAFACHASYPRGKTYTVTLARFVAGGPASLGRVPVNRDGSFRAMLVIPTGAAAGEAYLLVEGSAFDKCADTRNGSCVSGYDSPPLRIQPRR